MKKTLFLLMIFAVFISCKNEPILNKPDVLVANMDTTVRPGADFFDYANGGWIKRNPIPADQANWGIGNLVVEENLMRLRKISENAALSKAAQGSNQQKIGDFWTMAMDSAKIEADGLKPIQHLLDHLNQVNQVKDLIITIADFKKLGSNLLFDEYVGQDEKQSDVITYSLLQGGIGLPERQYYFKTDSTTVLIRNEYKKHITNMLILSGENATNATAAAIDILAMETKLATASRKIEDLRDPYKNYNKMAISDLNKMANNMPWSAYFEKIGVKNVDSLVVGQPEFFVTLNHVLVKTPITVWKQYVKFNLLSNLANVLPDAFGKESFSFSKLLTGAQQQKPRWKRAIEMEEDAMGEMLGQLYVKDFFNETAKQRYTNMVEDIRAAFKERIGKLSWMSDSTKQKAYIKLAAIKSKVGYPNTWKDFSSMEISRESLAKNYLNAQLWWHNYEYNKLGKPVNRNEWSMYPQTYNAYYSPGNNEIVLPAGIFSVPGYRDEELDDAVIYGYAGASTIGHEITHGFDDQGRQYDENGNLKSWWTKTDNAVFNTRAEVMVKQFNEYEPIKGYHINGSATLGENIADLGGILLGIEAFKKTKQYKENKTMGNLTPMQRYFMGYALGWLVHYRVETQKNRLLTDVHSPSKYRVNGPFVNVNEFYNAFNIKPGDNMYRPDSLRVRIW